MLRVLAYCISCDRMFVVNVNAHQAVEALEQIPESDQEEARKRKREKSHMELFAFGGCCKCEKPGWPVMQEVPYRGIP